MENSKYSSNRRVLLQLKEINEKHFKNIIDKKISKEAELKKMHEVFKLLSYKFNIFENFIRYIEQKEKKDYFDFLALSNYKVLINVRNFLQGLQLEIHEDIKKEGFIKFTMLEYQKKMGIPSYDYVDFYLEHYHEKTDWEAHIKGILTSNFGPLYYKVFLFQVLLIVLLNVKPEVEKFNLWAAKLDNTMKVFKAYTQK